MQRRSLFILGIAGAMYSTNSLAFKLGNITDALSGGGGSADEIKRLLAAAAKADAQMNYYFQVALKNKKAAVAYQAAVDGITVDNIEDEYEKLNELKDETRITDSDLNKFTASDETNAALAAGNAFGSVALINYAFLLPKIKSGIDEIKSSPTNLGLAQALLLAITAIPKAMTTINELIVTSSKIAESNSVPLKSQTEIAELSKEMGGTTDLSALP
jgi:hypothetical protein